MATRREDEGNNQNPGVVSQAMSEPPLADGRLLRTGVSRLNGSTRAPGPEASTSAPRG